MFFHEEGTPPRSTIIFPQVTRTGADPLDQDQIIADRISRAACGNRHRRELSGGCNLRLPIRIEDERVCTLNRRHC